MPDWLADKNKTFIISHYRAVGQPANYYLSSILALHNETFNIWSHLIPAILFMLSYVVFVARNITKPKDQRRCKNPIHLVFLMNAMGFLASAIFHTFLPYSPSIKKTLNV